jgi:hydroxymethylbilane synthase
MRSKLIIGTRGSALALWQAEHVAGRLRATSRGLSVDLRVIKTKGDKIQDVPLAKVGGKGLFVKEIELAMQRREVDLAVHSMKDVPAELSTGLVMAAVSAREDPRDALVSSAGDLAALPRGARVGTSSLRRRCQLLARRPDLEILDLRGNVDTRLRKLDEGLYDAVVLAAAGLRRLERADRITELIDPAWMIPAVGQGVLGVETREDDQELRALLQEAIHHPATSVTVSAERAFLGRLGGGCQVPVAAHALLEGEQLRLEGLIGHPAGSPCFRGQDRGPASAPKVIGERLADELLGRGGRGVLDEVYAAS